MMVFKLVRPPSTKRLQLPKASKKTKSQKSMLLPLKRLSNRSLLLPRRPLPRNQLSLPLRRKSQFRTVQTTSTRKARLQTKARLSRITSQRITVFKSSNPIPLDLWPLLMLVTSILVEIIKNFQSNIPITKAPPVNTTTIIITQTPSKINLPTMSHPKHINTNTISLTILPLLTKCTLAPLKPPCNNSSTSIMATKTVSTPNHLHNTLPWCTLNSNNRDPFTNITHPKWCMASPRTISLGLILEFIPHYQTTLHLTAM